MNSFRGSKDQAILNHTIRQLDVQSHYIALPRSYGFLRDDISIVQLLILPRHDRTCLGIKRLPAIKSIFRIGIRKVDDALPYSQGIESSYIRRGSKII